MTSYSRWAFDAEICSHMVIDTDAFLWINCTLNLGVIYKKMEIFYFFKFLLNTQAADISAQRILSD